MKNAKVIFFLFLMGFLSLPVMGQKRNCTVKATNLKGTYEGQCDRKLAHGKGKAVGKDTYQGKFKKGYPHGKGTCYYGDGSFYTGEWKKGMKHGEGQYACKINERDTVLAGRWKKDKYLGPIKKKPYKVQTSRGIDRYSFRKIGDENNKVTIKCVQNGMTNSGITDLSTFATKGSQFSSTSSFGYQTIDEFPFKCKVNYTTLNKLRTSSHNVIFLFIINEPGEWEITVYN